jgi:hypothetical protein
MASETMGRLPVADLADRLSEINNRTLLMTLDTLVSVIPAGGAGYRQAAVTAKTLAERLTDSARHFTG